MATPASSTHRSARTLPWLRVLRLRGAGGEWSTHGCGWHACGCRVRVRCCSRWCPFRRCRAAPDVDCVALSRKGPVGRGGGSSPFSKAASHLVGLRPRAKFFQAGTPHALLHREAVAGSTARCGVQALARPAGRRERRAELSAATHRRIHTPPHLLAFPDHAPTCPGRTKSGRYLGSARIGPGN
eukprot:361330-Chlamydomonas_euryale.AAC.7